MDRKILNLFFGGLLAMTFTSCEKDANIPVPEEDPKLVVYSYISPQDTAINVSVSVSNPVFGAGSNDQFGNKLETATVNITTNGNTYTLTYNPETQYYYISTSTVSVNPGQYFELSVSASGYTSVSASTTVPAMKDYQFQAAFKNKTEGDDNQPTIYRFDVNWQHFVQPDYYRLSASFYYSDTSMFAYVDTVRLITSENFYTYQQASGGKITDVMEAEGYYDTDFYPGHGYYLDLIVSTYDYYQFHQSVINYGSGNPFAEPQLVYTNMANGYGIFAGYLRLTKRIDM